MSLLVHTVGHSTRSADEFRALLAEFKIDKLVDIRQYPGSRRLPHFGREALRENLAEAGIGYEWLVSLGGRRSGGHPDSPNLGLRNASFRSYADYMLTPEFRAGIDQLCAWAEASPVAIMCAEAVYWRCHRRLVSDHLVAQGHQVLHIMGPGRSQPHALTPGAVIAAGAVTYPAAPLFP